MDQVSELAAALAKAQAEIKTPIKNQTVQMKFKDKNDVWREKIYKYADLAGVMDAIRDPLSKNGIAVFHKMGYCENIYGMRTFLIHSSGQYIDTWYPLPDPQKQQIKAQDFGSALTYARRYSLSGLVGIASEDDDDGEIAPPTQQPEKNQQQQKTSAQTQQPKNNPPMQKALDKAPPKNHAPGASNPPEKSELDKALDTPAMTTLEKIYAITDERGYTEQQSKDMIMRCLGALKPSTTWTVEEQEAVYKYLTITTK